MPESRLLLKTDPQSLSNALESLYLTTQEALRSWEEAGTCDASEASVILNQLKVVAGMMSLPRTLKFIAMLPEVNSAVGINWARMIVNAIESSPEIYRYGKQGAIYRLYAINLMGELRREAQSENESIIRSMAEASLKSIGGEFKTVEAGLGEQGDDPDFNDLATVIDFPVMSGTDHATPDSSPASIHYICDVRDHEPALITDENRFLPLELMDCMSGNRVAIHQPPKDGWTQETLQTHYSKTTTNQPVDALIGGEFVGSTEI